jgi:hypothetical protein
MPKFAHLSWQKRALFPSISPDSQFHTSKMPAQRARKEKALQLEPQKLEREAMQPNLPLTDT